MCGVIAAGLRNFPIDLTDACVFYDTL